MTGPPIDVFYAAMMCQPVFEGKQFETGAPGRAFFLL
jgi:hypothetical protein